MKRAKLFALVVIAALAGAAILAMVRVDPIAAIRAKIPPKTHTEQWQDLHGRAATRDLASCRECHDAVSCRTCHLAQWPHPARWQERHGREAARVAGRGCSFCHRPTFCDPCHNGVSMPHSKDWLKSHTRGVTDAAVCRTCHVLSDCTSCHTTHGRHNGGTGVSP